MKTVLVTRPFEQSKNLADELSSQGFETLIAPMMEIEPETDVVFPEIDKYDGVIVTSARTVTLIPKDYIGKGVAIYVVGKKTAYALKSLGYTNIKTIQRNLEDLKYYMIDAEIHGQKLLHLCGFHVAENLLNRHKCILYKALLTEDLEQDIQKRIATQNIHFTMLFSKRSAENFVRMIKKYNLEKKCETMTILCISSRVSNAVKGLPWADVRTAEEPNQDSMCLLLKSLVER